jgi:hypothetical protein
MTVNLSSFQSISTKLKENARKVCRPVMFHDTSLNSSWNLVFPITQKHSSYIHLNPVHIFIHIWNKNISSIKLFFRINSYFWYDFYSHKLICLHLFSTEYSEDCLYLS